MPHTIPHQLGHLNYAPKEVGGAFQYFKGTKHEVADISHRGAPAPADRVIAPFMPGPGYAIMQQGNMVVHQAKGLQEVGERITIVNGYVAADPQTPDYTRYDQLIFADPPEVVTSEYIRHIAHLAGRQLGQEAADLRFSTDREGYAARLQTVIDLLQDTKQQIECADDAKMEFFEAAK